MFLYTLCQTKTLSKQKTTKLCLNQKIPSAPEHVSLASGTEGDFVLTK